MDKDILQEAKEAFQEAQDASNENRTAALEDLEFSRLGEQWPREVKRQRELEGRPCLTINRLPSFIRQVVNDARLNKPQPKVLPVDDYSDVETAKIYNGLIRNIESVSRADIAYDTAIDYAASMGFGYIRIKTDYSCDDSFDQDILIDRVSNPFTVYEDPYATSADGSDWNMCFVTELMKKTAFEKEYPNAEIVDWNSDSMDEKDRTWFESDTVRVAEYWTREKVTESLLKLSDGQIITEKQYMDNKDLFDVSQLAVEQERQVKSFKVIQHIITGAEVLEKNEWPGRYIPVVPVYGEEFSHEGKRVLMSLVRQAKDAQRNFNYWRSAATELVALAPKAPYIGPAGFAKKDPNWETANTQNHSYLEYDGNIPPKREAFAGIPAGALQESLNASDDMKDIMGLHDASLGARSNETSGRAIMARQREGDISTFHFMDNMTRSIRQVGAILIDLIPHIYSEQRIVRVLGEDGEAKTVPINQPAYQDQQGNYLPVTDQTPEEQRNIARIYDLTAGKYDLTVSNGPSFTSRREEAATQMMELVRTFPDAAPLIGDLLAKNLDWPGADEIAERLKEINPANQKEQPEQPNPEVLKAQAELQMKQQELQMKQQENELDMRKAEIDLRIKEIDLQIQREKLQSEVAKDQLPIINNL